MSMNIQREADKRYPRDHEVDDPFGETGVARSDPYGYEEYANRAFVAGAEWSAEQAWDEGAAAEASAHICGDVLADFQNPYRQSR